MHTISSSLDRIKSGKMWSIQYLQTIVTILVAGEIIFRLSKDIYRTRKKQKCREGLIKLNWTVPNIANELKDKIFLRKYILLTYLLNSNVSTILNWIRDSQTKFSIKAAGSIIAAAVLSIILTGIVLKNFSPWVFCYIEVNKDRFTACYRLLALPKNKQKL